MVNQLSVGHLWSLRQRFVDKKFILAREVREWKWGTGRSIYQF